MSFNLCSTWHIIGPFLVPLREYELGVDPLEPYGGFSSLKYSKTSRFPSELTNDGQVGWLTMKASKDNTVGPILFPNTIWEQENGNSVERYQAWARGTLKVTEKSSILIQIHGVTTFFINQQRYSGDFYNHKTTSHFVEIDKGTHTLDVRLIHGMKPIPVDRDKEKRPSCQFSITIQPLESNITMDHHQLKHHHHYQLNTELLGREMIKYTLMPSFILDHGFAGNLGSITIQNLTPDILRVASIRLVIQAYHQTADVITIMRPTCLVQRSNHITLVKGQQRQIGFNFDLRNVHNSTFLQAENIKVKIIVSIASSVTTFNLVDEISINSINWEESSIFRYTFLDYDKSVQYAMAKRPTILDDDVNKPIILALHSVSFDIKAPSWTDCNSQKSIWIIFATGRTTCENDWQGRSVKNALSAVDELANVLELLFQGSDFKPPADDSDWIVVEKRGSFSIGNIKKLICIGYNNGGQGVWYLLTHYPDRAIGAIDIGGYKNYQNSDFSYNSLCYIDPLLYGTMEMAYTDFNIGLHLPNMVGVPILAKYKPNAHTSSFLQSRNNARLLNEYYKNANLVKFSLDDPIQNYNWNSIFNNDDVNNYITTLVNNSKQIPNKKEKFSIVTTNPATIGQIQGVQIEQLHIPFRKSQLDGYTIDDNTIILTSKNISALSIINRKETIIIIDGTRVQRHCSDSSILLVNYGDSWMVEKGKWPPRLERSRLTYGPIHRMYESSKPILIIIPSKNRITSSASSASTVYNIYQHIALQLAHDWHHYGTGDTIIVSDDHPLVSYEEIDLDDNTEPYFRIYLGVGDDNHALNQLLKNESSVDIKLESSSISVGNKKFTTPGSGIIFMCPGNNLNEIAVVLLGLDLNGLKTCSYLFPKRTDHLLPEWMVVNSLTNWQTLGGILSAGFFNNRWKAYGY